ncbi:MAG: GntR family transcriptional regulator [Anaerolineae bacterium]
MCKTNLTLKNSQSRFWGLDTPSLGCYTGLAWYRPIHLPRVPVDLQREAPLPLYVQLKESLVTEIRSGRYRAHQRLPSERVLATQFNVSRMTVRQALVELARAGAIYTRVGKGTFVAGPKIDQQLHALSGFSQDVRARGGHPASRVLEARVIPASLEVAAALRIMPNAEVVVLARLRLADGVPLAIETAHLPLALVPDLLSHDFATESLYNVLETRYGLLLTQAEQTIEAALANTREIELLELTPPAAVLRMQRLTLADSVPVEYVLSTYRGDCYKFRSTLRSGKGVG